MRRQAAAQRRPSAQRLANGVAVDPGVCGGKPVIKGTRVPVYLIVGGIAGGSSIEEICESYNLTPAQVRAALAYAAQVLEEEQVVALPSR